MVLLGSVLLGAIAFIVISDYLFLKKDRSTLVRLSIYKETMLMQWTILLLVCAAWLIGGFSWQELVMIDSSKTITVTARWMAGFLTGVVIATIVIIVMLSMQTKKKRQLVGDIDFLFPQTKKERIAFTFVSATAGICEEIIFRGAMTVFLLSLPFDWSLSVVGIIGSVLFGLAHYYQGWKGMLATGIAGYALFNIYMMTGSLLIPIIVHFLIDVKLVFIPSTQKKEAMA